MTEIEFRDDMTVRLDGVMGSDADIARIARVSTKAGDGNGTKETDAALIRFLMRNRHGSPFEHAVFRWYIEAPIFVWREFMRHRIASYNEESGRYRELRPVFYVPNRDRKLVQSGKPGLYRFEDGDADQHWMVEHELTHASQKAYNTYQLMLEAGIAREVARMVLPLNIYSSAYVTMNARAAMNFISLRTVSEGSLFPSFPQREIEMVADQMEEDFADHLPVTHGAFCEKGRVSP